MKTIFILWISIIALSVASTAGADGRFTDEASILAVTRQDQTPLLKIRMLKEELTLPQVLVVVTTYSKVDRDQYMVYAHQPGPQGTVTLKGDVTHRWEIEPNYAAKVTDRDGNIAYLLHPRLKATAKK